MNQNFESWGRYPQTEQTVYDLFWSKDFPSSEHSDGWQLPVGMGRSYGDVCLNDGNVLLSTRGMDRLLAFDAVSGVIRCEGGVTLAAILDFVVPRGWFLPVTPGTKFVSVGGAIANDVHGKNHHIAGTFGRYLDRFELVRSDGSHLECSPTKNAEWYSATIGGLGLTGLIVWAEIQLKKIVSRKIDNHSVKFSGLNEFLKLSQQYSGREYAVAWADCVTQGKNSPRGIFMSGSHSEAAGPLQQTSQRNLVLPFDFPSFALNSRSVRLFNTVYFHKHFGKEQRTRVDYEPFFYPLDAILHWNRMYGKNGLLQFQCVIPHSDGPAAMAEMLDFITKSGLASFLVVLKTCGDIASPGMMSFPMPGITLALDFPIRAVQSFKLVDRLGEMTLAAKGRLYPAKDARMTAAQFQSSYPRFQEFSRFVDPRFSSSFWRRVAFG